MALSQDDRIAISKKLVDIPKENAAALDNKAKLDEAQVKAQKQDDANKTLMDDKTVLINGYQNEIKRLDGNDRTEVLEQDVIDSAVNKFQNFFAPNDIATSLPSIPDGIWKNFIPFSGSKAIGKKYNETYDTIQKEGDIISTINGYITTMEAYVDIERSTGQKCNGGSGSCSLPIYLTELDCNNNGGTWTVGPDIISNDATLQALAASIITEINNWKTFIQTTQGFIVTTDTDVTRQNQNNVAIADITNALSVINNWLGLATFDTAHGQTTCAGFYAYNVNLLSSTKFRASELNTLKAEITARLSFITTRITELNTNLGGVVQNFTDGSITSFSGLYGSRFNIINLRLNLMNGSARKVEGLKLGKKAQDEAISSNNSAQAVYSDVMKVSLFRAPSLGTNTIHIKDATGFSISDTVYVVSDTQTEIQTVINSISGSMIILADNIPAKYRQNENARLYKVI